MSHDGHVSGAEAFAQTGLVLAESDIEDPMQAVLDPPVTAHGLGSACGIERGGGDVIACLAVCPAGALGLSLNANQAGDARQAEFTRKATIARQPVDLTNDADLTPLDAAMAFVMLEVAGDGLRRRIIEACLDFSAQADRGCQLLYQFRTRRCSSSISRISLRSSRISAP